MFQFSSGGWKVFGLPLVVRNGQKQNMFQELAYHRTYSLLIL